MKTEPLALDFKSATLYAIRVVLHDASLENLKLALATRMKDAGSFFENEPVVVDASRVDDPVDWPALIDALRGHRLPPIGVVAEGANLQAACAAGLAPVELSETVSRTVQTTNLAAATADAADAPVLTVRAEPLAATATTDAPAPGNFASAGESGGSDASASSGRPAASEDTDPAIESDPSQKSASPDGASSSETPATTEPASAHAKDTEASANPALSRPSAAAGRAAAPARAPQSSSALVINKPLRSGQRVYARQCDLIVIGMVSRGAEVIADGNVHIYGPLRGKAMAGARGDTAAQIFTTQMDAELLAVAGVYRVVEAALDPSLHNQPALVRLEGENLHIEKLGA